MYHKAWTDGKPSSVLSMGNHLSKHILPRFGAWALDSVDERAVQEFVADLRRATFERRNAKGEVIKRYRLSRKTIANIVGVVKLVLGRKRWLTWDLDLGKPEHPAQRYFTEEQLRQIVAEAPGRYRVLFAVLAGTGMRAGEVAGLHVEDVDLDNQVIYVRRAVWNGREQPPKTRAAVRQIDVDGGLAALLRQHLAGRTSGRAFLSRPGGPIAGENIRKRVLVPLLKRLGIPKAGLHAFRHSRVTMLRKRGTPADLQLQWIGHSSLRTTDRYSHTDQELEYRRAAAASAGLNFVVGPNGPNLGVAAG